MLFQTSGVPPEVVPENPIPRDTKGFDYAFKGLGVLRSADITKDPRNRQDPPFRGMLASLRVRSYLAVPVKARSGGVVGGLFFGHPDADQFSAQHEQLAVGIASWASVALENAALYRSVREANRLKDDFLATL